MRCDAFPAAYYTLVKTTVNGEVNAALSLPNDLPGLAVWVNKYLDTDLRHLGRYRASVIGVSDGYEGARDCRFWSGFGELLDGAIKQAELFDAEFAPGSTAR